MRIKERAFWPETHPETKIYETSVMHTHGLNEDEEVAVGHEVAKLRGKPLLGVVRTTAGIPDEVGLTTELDGDGHALHATIKGWPASKEDMMDKLDQLVEALNGSESTLAWKIGDPAAAP